MVLLLPRGTRVIIGTHMQNLLFHCSQRRLQHLPLVSEKITFELNISPHIQAKGSKCLFHINVKGLPQMII